MRPTLIEIGNFKLPSFGILVLAGFMVGIWFAGRRAHRFGLTKTQIGDASLYMLLFGALGARIAYIVQNIAFFSANPKELFALQWKGMTSFGGLILGAVALVVFCKRRKIPVVSVLDCVAPSVLIAHAIGRVGCLLNGCCHGGACPPPLGVHVPDLPGTYHPAQIYDAGINLAWLGVVLSFEPRLNRPGQIFGLMLIGHGLSRIIAEIWRFGNTGESFLGLPFTSAQFAASLVVLIGVVFLVLGSKQSQRVEPSAQEVPSA